MPRPPLCAAGHHGVPHALEEDRHGCVEEPDGHHCDGGEAKGQPGKVEDVDADRQRGRHAWPRPGPRALIWPRAYKYTPTHAHTRKYPPGKTHAPATGQTHSSSCQHHTKCTLRCSPRRTMSKTCPQRTMCSCRPTRSLPSSTCPDGMPDTVKMHVRARIARIFKLNLGIKESK